MSPGGPDALVTGVTCPRPVGGRLASGAAARRRHGHRAVGSESRPPNRVTSRCATANVAGVYQVVILPPPGILGEVEELRRRHDPAFHRVPAHIALVGAFEPVSEQMLDAFDRLRPGRTFGVTFGAPQTHGHTLVLPIERGADELTRIRSQAAEALLPPESEQPAGPVVLRVGMFSGDAERELVRRGLAANPPEGEFTVAELTLLLEDSRGLWHPVRRRPLRRGGA